MNMGVATYRSPSADEAWSIVSIDDMVVDRYRFAPPQNDGVRNTATVFHLQEVMRKVLLSLPDQERGLHSSSIIEKFGKLSLFGGVVFEEWNNVLETLRTKQKRDAQNFGRQTVGDATQNILRQMMGVKISSENRWLPQRDFSIIGPINADGIDYFIIDDIQPTYRWMELTSEADIIVVPETGLRLTRVIPTGQDVRITDLDEFLGAPYFYETPEQWLTWLLRRAEEKSQWISLEEYRNDYTGEQYYFTRYPDQDQLLDYDRWGSLRNGPNHQDSNQAWWQRERRLGNFPRISIDGFSGFIGTTWRYDNDPELRYPWFQKGLHFYDPERQMCLEISAHSLSIWPERTEGSRFAGQGVESGKLRRFNLKLFTMTTRAIQTSCTNAGMGSGVEVGRIENNFGDRGLNLGDSWTSIESPYSHHFLVKWNPQRRGLLAGSVIHKTVARRILELNWWRVGE